MTTSGSTDFTLAANQIIEEAFDICGIGSEGEAISADQYDRALRSLNLIVKHKGVVGHLWTRTDKSVALVASQAAYTLTPRPLRVLEVRRKSGDIEVPLMEWAREQYKAMPNKTTASIPTAFYYDPQVAGGTLYIWPTASAATAAAMTLEMTYQRVIEDFDGSGDDSDVPQEQLRSLVWDLAGELALKYAVRPDLRAEITARAAQYRAEAESWDTEPASLFLQPEKRW